MWDPILPLAVKVCFFLYNYVWIRFRFSKVVYELKKVLWKIFFIFPGKQPERWNCTLWVGAMRLSAVLTGPFRDSRAAPWSFKMTGFFRSHPPILDAANKTGSCCFQEPQSFRSAWFYFGAPPKSALTPLEVKKVSTCCSNDHRLDI